METTTADGLKKRVYDRLDQCRRALEDGNVDMHGVQESVRDYCARLESLPAGESAAHRKDLEEMMLQLEALSGRLVAERDGIRAQLDGLGRLRQASIAYQTSDAIGGKRVTKGND